MYTYQDKCNFKWCFYASSEDQLLNYLTDQPFLLVSDGSSNLGLKKMIAVGVLIFDVKRSKTVKFEFSNMCVSSGEMCLTAATLLDVINQFDKRK